jgi:hypothetical protein
MESVKRYSPYKEVKLLAEASEARRLETQAKLDRVSAENLALQQRLTVQDQREDDMKSLLRVALLAVEDMEEIHGDNGDTSSARSMRDLADKINAALNPTSEAESHE